MLLLVMLTAVGTFLIGLVAGPWYSLPVVRGWRRSVSRPGDAGGAVAGLRPDVAAPGRHGAGRGHGAAWPVLPGQSPAVAPDLETAKALWSAEPGNPSRVSPGGGGAGAFPSIQPYFKDRDMSSTTAMSSVFQWGVEAGAAGWACLALAVLWSLRRIPGGLSRVGSVDRSLAYGLIGAALGFSLLAVVHWTVECRPSQSGPRPRWNLESLAGGRDRPVRGTWVKSAHPGCGSGRSRSHDAAIHLSPHSGQPIGPDSRRGDSLDHGADRPRGLLRGPARRAGLAARRAGFSAGAETGPRSLGSKGAILVQDRAVEAPRPLPFDVPFPIGRAA